MGKGMACAVRHARARTALLLVAPLLLAGCATGGDGEDAANQLLFSPDATPATSVAATPSGAPPPPFPESCTDLVPTPEVVEIVAAPLPGGTTFVYADAQPDIKRVQRITCGYGVPEAAEGQPAPTPADPAVEITLNEYEDGQAAQDRVDVTLESAAAEGSQIATVPLGPLEGTVLRSTGGVTMVVRQDARTVVVSLRAGLVPAAAENLVLAALAGRVLGVSTSTEPTPSPSVTPPATPLAN